MSELSTLESFICLHEYANEYELSKLQNQLSVANTQNVTIKFEPSM